ncbi:hypothetical protein BG011_008305 [Mortierella polycephala]|uniref:Ion transport domain-containing protein n=1 Tax=Mortierella polycephala TaxID=41804 RepID=A0A9P6U843_9FUNG|nr:hypothetical protein BG011_008305 [Mortierella polycephala]
MFFFISVGGIIAFSIAILHLLRSCPFENCEEADPPTLFPQHFYGAVSATFFFMGGRYDSINDDMDSSNWAFHTMMIVFFFFTVILMLNVLIALINLAFVDGDETWRLEWLQNRLRVIESVENLTFHIPGFRQHYNCWFPNEIYYSVTAMEIEDFKAEYPSDFIDPNPSTDTPESNTTLMTEKPIQELKDELKQAREQISLMKGEIQMALQEQSTAHQNQMTEIQAMLATLLKDKASSS